MGLAVLSDWGERSQQHCSFNGEGYKGLAIGSIVVKQTSCRCISKVDNIKITDQINPATRLRCNTIGNHYFNRYTAYLTQQ
jgi:hypothetical protein